MTDEITACPAIGAIPSSLFPPKIALMFRGSIHHVEQSIRVILSALSRSRNRYVNEFGTAIRLWSSLCGAHLASLFYEASTRTDSRLAAMRRFGGSVVSASNGVQFSPFTKAKIWQTPCARRVLPDLIALRHRQKGLHSGPYYLDRLTKISRSRVCRQRGRRHRRTPHTGPARSLHWLTESTFDGLKLTWSVISSMAGRTLMRSDRAL